MSCHLLPGRGSFLIDVVTSDVTFSVWSIVFSFDVAFNEFRSMIQRRSGGAAGGDEGCH